MTTFRCTIHDVQFTCEPPESATRALKEECSIAICPICLQEDNRKLDTHLRRIMAQRDALIYAIEIKQEALLTKSFET